MGIAVVWRGGVGGGDAVEVGGVGGRWFGGETFVVGRWGSGGEGFEVGFAEHGLVKRWQGVVFGEDSWEWQVMKLGYGCSSDEPSLSCSFFVYYLCGDSCKVQQCDTSVWVTVQRT